MPRKSRPVIESLDNYEIDPHSGCWNWTGLRNERGYGIICHKSKNIYAHRASYEHRAGPLREGHYICHKCDNPSCINPAHLFQGRPKDNTQDMIAKGRKTGPVKLTPEDVAAIRSLTEAQSSIARRFGVSQSMVSLIRSGKARSNVAG